MKNYWDKLGGSIIDAAYEGDRSDAALANEYLDAVAAQDYAHCAELDTEVLSRADVEYGGEYVTGDGKTHRTWREAEAWAGAVHDRGGSVVSIDDTATPAESNATIERWITAHATGDLSYPGHGAMPVRNEGS